MRVYIILHAHEGSNPDAPTEARYIGEVVQKLLCDEAIRELRIIREVR